jgi:hypothetical protein
MILEIKYSLQLEKQRVKKTIEKLSWYERLGYSPRFPQNVNPKNDNLKKIYSAIKYEYIEEDYKNIAAEIKIKFSEIEKDFCEKFKKLYGKKIRKNFKLILTKYGVGGSYSLPNKIILNINMKSLVNTILHEITHLVIESYIQKYKIPQNQKERIVDLILSSKSIALKGYVIQKRGEEYKKIIDPLFVDLFNPPIDNFFKALEKINTKKQ